MSGLKEWGLRLGLLGELVFPVSDSERIVGNGVIIIKGHGGRESVSGEIEWVVA